jgi:hypothetical protein
LLGFHGEVVLRYGRLMIERFRVGDVGRVVSTPPGWEADDPSPVGREVVFNCYSYPNDEATGWTVLVDADDETSPTGIHVWCLDETNVAPTGFRVDPIGRRVEIGERDPSVRGDEVYLRLVTDLLDDTDAAPVADAVRALVAPFASPEKCSIELKHHPEHHEISLIVCVYPQRDALALFDAFMTACPSGWDGPDDDGWRREAEWDRRRASHDAQLLHPAAYWAELMESAWSSPSRRHIASATSDAQPN